MRKLFTDKKGLTTNTILSFIIGLVLVVILLEVAAVLVPTAQTSGDTLNATGVPLGNLFAAGGVIFLIIMAALLLVIVLFFMKGLMKNSK